MLGLDHIIKHEKEKFEKAQPGQAPKEINGQALSHAFNEDIVTENQGIKRQFFPTTPNGHHEFAGGQQVLSFSDSSNETSEAMYYKSKLIKQINAAEILSPKALLDKALTHVACLWLLQGVPKREELAKDFASLPEDKQREGLKVKRINTSAFTDTLENNGYKDGRFDFKAAWESFNELDDSSELYRNTEEQNIPYRAIQVLKEALKNDICRSNDNPDEYLGETWGFNPNKLDPKAQRSFSSGNLCNLMTPLNLKSYVFNNEEEDVKEVIKKLFNYDSTNHMNRLDRISINQGASNNQHSISIFKDGSYSYKIGHPHPNDEIVRLQAESKK